MKNKTLSIGAIACGLVFIILGTALFIIQNGDAIVMIIAGLDLLFGITLVVGSLIRKNDADDSSADEQENYFDDYPSYDQPSASYSDDYQDDGEDDNYSAAQIDPAELAAREGELRIAAKRAAEEATRAKKTATAAVHEAKRAEEELQAAEEELAYLDPASQRAAMRRIDMLAQTAAEKSEIAVNEARKAKLAIRSAREAAELHSKAMDAAAAALSGVDEFSDFN